MTAPVAAKRGGDGVFDSLPYFEAAHEDYEEYALALIEDEMKLVAPTRTDGVAEIKYRSQIMENECNLLIVGSKFVPRQDLPTQKNRGRPQGEADCASSIREGKRMYEYERIRSQILDAEKSEVAESWKLFNESLSLHQTKLSGMVKNQSEVVQEINYGRQKLQQQQLGPQIDELAIEYRRTLYQRNQIKHGICSIHGNVASL